MKLLQYFAGLGLSILAGCFAVLMTAGCQSSPVYMDLPGTPSGGTNTTHITRAGSVMTNWNVDFIHVGDVLLVTSAGPLSDPPFPMYSETVKEDGTITPLYVGSVRVVGKTTGELQKELQKGYEKKFVNITVTVRIGDRYFYVDGEVNKRAPALYLGETDIVSAIAAAGGFTDFANKKKIRLIHPNNRIEVIDYNKAILDSRRYPVYPGDKIYVPRKWF